MLRLLFASPILLFGECMRGTHGLSHWVRYFPEVTAVKWFVSQEGTREATLLFPWLLHPSKRPSVVEFLILR